MDLGEILKRAWQVIWKNKLLLLFPAIPFLLTFPVFVVGLIGPENLAGWLNDQNHQWILITVTAVAVAISSLLVIVTQAYLVRGVVLVETEGSLNAGRLFGQDPHLLLRGAGMYLIYQLVIGSTITMLMLLGIGVGAVTAGLGFLCLSPFFLLLTPVLLGLDAWLNFSLTAALSGESGFFASFGLGWQLLRRRSGPVALLVLIVYLIRMAVQTITFTPYYLVVLSPLFFLSSMTIPAMTVLRTVLLLGLLFNVLLTVSAAIMTAYTTAIYVTAYLRLSSSASVAIPSSASEQGA